MPRLGRTVSLLTMLVVLSGSHAFAQGPKGRPPAQKSAEARAKPQGKNPSAVEAPGPSAALKSDNPDDILHEVATANAKAQAALKTTVEQREAAEASAV